MHTIEFSIGHEQNSGPILQGNTDVVLSRLPTVDILPLNQQPSVLTGTVPLTSITFSQVTQPVDLVTRPPSVGEISQVNEVSLVPSIISSQPVQPEATLASPPVEILNPHSNIMNLSRTFQLTAMQTQVLEKGLTFVPRPEKQDWGELRRDTYRYHRRLKLIDYFQDTDVGDQVPFTLPSSWEPGNAQLDVRIKRLIQLDNQALDHYNCPSDRQDNLTSLERESLKELGKIKNIIIKPADKGSKIVILDTFQYVFEANRQLSDARYYRPITESMQKQSQVRLREIVVELYRRKFITARQRNFLFGPDDPRPRIFYLLPKIHKDPGTWTIPHRVPPGRPIVSDCSSESYNIAQFIDHFLNPLSMLHPSYLRDTYDFLAKIKPIVVPSGTYIFTIDIDSLYTNIDTVTGLRAVEKLFQSHPDNNRPDQALLQLLELSLTCNDFVFDDKHYLQIRGTAMGKKFAPAYANIYMAEWEREVLVKCPLKPVMYYRYLDDIIGLWPYSLQDFDAFIQILNTHHASITVKYDIHPTEVNFLDTTVYFNQMDSTQKQLHTKVYFKDTDTHALLHKHSYHPKHTFPGIVKSQIIRFHRICSSTQHFNEAIQILFTALRRRGYSKRFLRTIKNSTLVTLSPSRLEHMERSLDSQVDAASRQDPNLSPVASASVSPSTATRGHQRPSPGSTVEIDSVALSRVTQVAAISPSLGTHSPENVNLIPLITTFSHRLQPLHHTFKQNFTKIQQAYPALGDYRIISALRKNKNFGDLLVRSAFSSLPDRVGGPSHTNHFKARKFIRNPYSRTSAPIGDSLSLNTPNIVYIITCIKCQKHYIGETKHPLQVRLKQHLSQIRGTTNHTTLYTHFRLHSISSLIITGLECGVQWTNGQRKLFEHRWIERLKTVVPNGLNEKP